MFASESVVETKKGRVTLGTVTPADSLVRKLNEEGPVFAPISKVIVAPFAVRKEYIFFLDIVGMESQTPKQIVCSGSAIFFTNTLPFAAEKLSQGDVLDAPEEPFMIRHIAVDEFNGGLTEIVLEDEEHTFVLNSVFVGDADLSDRCKPESANRL